MFSLANFSFNFSIKSFFLIVFMKKFKFSINRLLRKISIFRIFLFQNEEKYVKSDEYLL
jgi:hypothetical protein